MAWGRWQTGERARLQLVTHSREPVYLSALTHSGEDMTFLNRFFRDRGWLHNGVQVVTTAANKVQTGRLDGLVDIVFIISWLCKRFLPRSNQRRLFGTKPKGELCCFRPGTAKHQPSPGLGSPERLTQSSPSGYVSQRYDNPENGEPTVISRGNLAVSVRETSLSMPLPDIGYCRYYFKSKDKHWDRITQIKVISFFKRLFRWLAKIKDSVI